MALASQNTWNVLSEIIPTSDLKNNLHDICPKANWVISIRHVCSPWDFQNPMRMRYALLWCPHTMHIGSPWQQQNYNDSQIFIRKACESKMMSKSRSHDGLISKSTSFLLQEPLLQSENILRYKDVRFLVLTSGFGWRWREKQNLACPGYQWRWGPRADR